MEVHASSRHLTRSDPLIPMDCSFSLGRERERAIQWGICSEGDSHSFVCFEGCKSPRQAGLGALVPWVSFGAGKSQLSPWMNSALMGLWPHSSSTSFSFSSELWVTSQTQVGAPCGSKNTLPCTLIEALGTATQSKIRGHVLGPCWLSSAYPDLHSSSHLCVTLIRGHRCWWQNGVLALPLPLFPWLCLAWQGLVSARDGLILLRNPKTE